MRKRGDINIDPSGYKLVSLWEPEEKDETPFISFIEEIYYSLIQNNNSLEILFRDYYNKSQTVISLQDRVRSLEETVQMLEAKVEILQVLNKEKTE